MVILGADLTWDIAVLPPVIHEEECHSFKFWFCGTVKEGMVYHRELFCRLRTVPSIHRANLYQEACRLAHRDAVVVTASSEQYSMWVSLRSKNCMRLLQARYPFPETRSTLKNSSHSISS